MHHTYLYSVEKYVPSVAYSNGSCCHLQVYNKVVFEMSEEGAESQDRSQEDGVPLPLTVNRPFFFSIVEGNSNAILMLGKVTNPTL